MTDTIPDEIPLRRVEALICEACLDGTPSECHTPGCAFWFCPSVNPEQGARLRDHAVPVERAVWETQHRDEQTHWGASPSHGGLCKHRGPRETCSAPDCADDPEQLLTRLADAVQDVIAKAERTPHRNDPFFIGVEIADELRAIVDGAAVARGVRNPEEKP